MTSVLNILKYLLLLIFLLGLMQMISWVIGLRLLRRRLYFPFPYGVCVLVYDSKSLWWETAKRHLTYKPEKASVLGGLCTALWPLLIVLNVLLLAQVLGVFFPGGRRIPFPWVGVYSVFPLLMGFLYAIAQTFFGVFTGHVKPRKWKAALLFIIAITVVVESGLSAYRAWLLSSGGEEVLSQTMWDMVMARGGILLGAFLGLIVPIGESLIGTFSLLQFIEPMVESVIHWFFGLIGLIWIVIVWWLCGFYSDRPVPGVIIEDLEGRKKERKKPGVRRKLIPGQVADLASACNRLYKDIQKLQERMNSDKRLSSKPEHFDTVARAVNSLNNRIDELKVKTNVSRTDRLKSKIDIHGEDHETPKEKWDRQMHNLFPMIQEADSWHEVNRIKRIIEDEMSAIDANVGGFLTQIEQLEDRAVSLPMEIDGWSKAIPRYERQMENAEDTLARLSLQYEDLEKELDNTSAGNGKPGDSDWMFGLRNTLRAMKPVLDNSRSRLEGLKSRFDESFGERLELPSELDKQRVEAELLSLDESIADYRKSHFGVLNELRRKCRFRKCALLGRRLIFWHRKKKRGE